MKFHKPCTAKLLLVLTVATCLAPALCAKVTVSPLFADNAVIQRDAEVPVWGRAAAGEAVTVVFAGQTQTTVADAGGNWEVRLAPLKAGVKGPLTIRGKNVVTMKNVVTGDVWLCSGQSNMGLKVSAVTNAPAEIARQVFLHTRNDLPGAVRRSRNARRLLVHADLRDDVEFCLQMNRFTLVAASDTTGAIRKESGG